ncbi:uncharacterized protein [Typha latifolia]|uniref:uncharacterized protein n=1 Tax=Typha latifolia TaxID=4733 RepID=UPI003C2F1F43
MVSKTPTKSPRTPPKNKPKPLFHHRRKRSSSPLKALVAAPSAVAASIDRSLRSCRRRLIKIFARLAVFGTPKRHKQGFRRLQSPTKRDSAPPPPPHPLPPSWPKKKTIFLDLDETLIHSKTDPPPEKYDFVVHPMIDGHVITFYVLKRPGVDEFLRKAAAAFEVVVFTAGLKEYASLVLDRLDPAGEVICHRLYRDSCKEMEGRFVKDLSITGRGLDMAVIVDDNPNAYMLQPENAIQVTPFVNDLGDQELRKVIRFLEVAALFEDTREAIKYFLSDCVEER